VTLPQIPPECVATNSITVQWAAGRRLEIDNECIRVNPGDSVTVTFNPAPPARAARTKAGLFNRWINRRNDDPGNPATITLGPAPGGEQDAPPRSYKYEIHIEGAGVLDPRIVI
jgi:hypothetical protein